MIALCYGSGAGCGQRPGQDGFDQDASRSLWIFADGGAPIAGPARSYS